MAGMELARSVFLDPHLEVARFVTLLLCQERPLRSQNQYYREQMSLNRYACCCSEMAAITLAYYGRVVVHLFPYHTALNLARALILLVGSWACAAHAPYPAAAVFHIRPRSRLTLTPRPS